jgi:hypothetical protein
VGGSATKINHLFLNRNFLRSIFVSPGDDPEFPIMRPSPSKKESFFRESSREEASCCDVYDTGGQIDFGRRGLVLEVAETELALSVPSPGPHVTVFIEGEGMILSGGDPSNDGGEGCDLRKRKEERRTTELASQVSPHGKDPSVGSEGKAK